MKFQEKVVAIDAEETRLRKTWLSPTSNAKAGQNSERPFSLRKEQKLGATAKATRSIIQRFGALLDGYVVKDPLRGSANRVQRTLLWLCGEAKRDGF